MRTVLLFALVLIAGGAIAGRADTKPSIQAVRDYAVEWQRQLAAVVAEERYEQSSTEWLRGRGMARGPRRLKTRRLVSDVLLVRPGARGMWLMFRDVLEVDGQAVRDRQSRFDELFARPASELVTNARRIADESARYNLGRLTRNINTPATTLVFLDEMMARSTKWKGPRRIAVDGATAWEFTFEQTRPPFAIMTPTGRPQAAKGRICVDAATGRILMTELSVRNTSLRPQSEAGMVKSVTRLTARFGPVARIEPWVPLGMEERMEVEGGFDELLVGEATYTNHRVFQTSVRIVGPESR